MGNLSVRAEKKHKQRDWTQPICKYEYVCTCRLSKKETKLLSSVIDMWVRQRVLICKTNDAIRRTSIWTVIGNYLFYNVEQVSALIMGHNEARVRIVSKITIAHNTLLLNWLISQHYSICKYFIDCGRNNKIKNQLILKYYKKCGSNL